MSLLNRPDGIQFVVQPYRERIAISKRSTMMQRVKLLSEQHGQYALLSRLDESSIEAVFSKELGYLLGETVWHYFDKPQYLIFCERLSKDHKQVLLVIIRDNEVYLDILVDNDKLRGELLPLMTMQETYRVITFGEVSLTQNPGPGNFELPKNLVNSFELAKEPVFTNLPILASTRLLSLQLALKSTLLGSKIPTVVIATFAILFLATVWWIYAMIAPHKVEVAPSKIIEQPNLAFADFYNAMKTPSPEQQFNELARIIMTFYALPGWQAGSLNYSGGQYRIQLTRIGGTLKWLGDWVVSHQFGLNLNSTGAEIIAPSQLSPRPRPNVTYPLSQVVVSLIDQLDMIFPNQSVTIGDPKMLGQTKSRIINISFHDATPETLILIGKTLGNELPLSVSAINVNVRGGLLNGTVQLSVWGI